MPKESNQEKLFRIQSHFYLYGQVGSHRQVNSLGKKNIHSDLDKGIKEF